MLVYSVNDTSLMEEFYNSIEKVMANPFSSRSNGKLITFSDDYFKGNKNLNILAVPDGYMHHFPLELLPVFSESDTTKRFYLGEIANISYVPSLSSYVKLSSKKRRM